MSEGSTWFDAPIHYPPGTRVSVSSVVRVAIDPGKNGGIVELWPGQRVPVASSMPKTEGDIVDHIQDINRRANIEGFSVCCTCEQVTGYHPPKRRRPDGALEDGNANASRAFEFGRNYGFLLGMIRVLGWRVEMVTPQKWQKAVGAGARSTYGEKWKNHLKDMACRLYPNNKPTLLTSDALLILEYATKGGKE
jgi:hypothetical protein